MVSLSIIYVALVLSRVCSLMPVSKVTGSHDLSLRLWERTQEPLVLSEEREMVRIKKDILCLKSIFSMKSAFAGERNSHGDHGRW